MNILFKCKPQALLFCQHAQEFFHADDLLWKPRPHVLWASHLVLEPLHYYLFEFFPPRYVGLLDSTILKCNMLHKIKDIRKIKNDKIDQFIYIKHK